MGRGMIGLHPKPLYRGWEAEGFPGFDAVKWVICTQSTSTVVHCLHGEMYLEGIFT